MLLHLFVLISRRGLPKLLARYLIMFGQRLVGSCSTVTTSLTCSFCFFVFVVHQKPHASSRRGRAHDLWRLAGLRVDVWGSSQGSRRCCWSCRVQGLKSGDGRLSPCPGRDGDFWTGSPLFVCVSRVVCGWLFHPSPSHARETLDAAGRTW